MRSDGKGAAASAVHRVPRFPKFSLRRPRLVCYQQQLFIRSKRSCCCCCHPREFVRDFSAGGGRGGEGGREMRRVWGVGTGDKRPNKVHLNIEAARPFSPCPYKELLVDPDTLSSLAATPGADPTPPHAPPSCRHHPLPPPILPPPVGGGHVWWNILK